jgi:hypothetical protein
MPSPKRPSVKQKVQQTIHSLVNTTFGAPPSDSSKEGGDLKRSKKVEPIHIMQDFDAKASERRGASPSSRNPPSTYPRIAVLHQRTRVTPVARRASQANAHADVTNSREPIVRSALNQSLRNIPDVPPVTDKRHMTSMYDLFLRLRADNAVIKSLQMPVSRLTHEYHQDKFRDTNMKMCILVILLIWGFVVVDILGVFTVERFPSAAQAKIVAIDLAALVAGVVAVAFFVASLVHRYFHDNGGDTRLSGSSSSTSLRPSTRLRRWCQACVHSSAVVRAFSDGLVVSLTLFTGLATLSRTLQDACADPTGLTGDLSTSVGWVTDSSCGVGEVRHSVPLETYALCLYVVLLPQMFCKGVSRGGICLSW